MEWKKTEPTNFFKMSWAGNCGGGYKSAAGDVLKSDSPDDKRCDWTLDVDTYKNVEYEITVKMMNVDK